VRLSLGGLALGAVALTTAAGCANPSPQAVTHTATPAQPPTATVVGPAAATSTSTVQQMIRVTASSYGTSYARLTAYVKRSSGWVRVLGPWTARIGRNGFAPAGKKREGDGRTPSGTYGFASFFFGVNARPSGIHYSWRHAYSYDVWDDDSASSRYNLRTDLHRYSAGRSPEALHQVPAYNYAAVIAYNTARKPGLGSAIFLHVSHHSATAGCVSLPQSELLRVLRWLNPTLHPRIVMGVT